MGKSSLVVQWVLNRVYLGLALTILLQAEHRDTDANFAQSRTVRSKLPKLECLV